jgi:hypothetical protein
VFVGEDDGLYAVAEVELREDAADVALDGRFGHDESVGDLAVRESARDEYEDLLLAGRDLLEERCRWFERVGAGGEVFD